MKKCLYSILIILGVTMSKYALAELIVLATPPSDGYYEKFHNKIIDFQIDYAKEIICNSDDVIILSSKELYSTYADEIGPEHVLAFPMDDIWMRDFTLTNPSGTAIVFRYTAEAQGGYTDAQQVADQVQKTFLGLAKDAGLKYKTTRLLNDGGNLVDDYSGNLILSTKFLHDNHLSENQARQKLMALTGAKHVAFIESDEPEGLQHADGIASFVDDDVVVINEYPDDESYARTIKSELERQLPDVTVYSIVAPYDASSTYDSQYPSACGLYTNMLVTPDSIYFPQFGIPDDKIAIQQLQAITKKKIVPVSSEQVCGLGGGVRCMSLQLRGKNAQRLIDYASAEEE